jgi:hypothetical protein
MLEKTHTVQGIDPRRVVMVVAYPGDETLLGGGHILSNPTWGWHVISVFESSRSTFRKRFFDALERLGATGEVLGFSSSDSPKTPRLKEALASAIQDPGKAPPALLVTHNPKGECERLPGRDRIGRMLARLWREEQHQVSGLWMFAYEEGSRGRLYAIDDCDRSVCLPPDILAAKRRILTDVYGFTPDSFVASACPEEEAFHCFRDRDASKLMTLIRAGVTLSPSTRGTNLPR